MTAMDKDNSMRERPASADRRGPWPSSGHGALDAGGGGIGTVILLVFNVDIIYQITGGA